MGKRLLMVLILLCVVMNAGCGGGSNGSGSSTPTLGAIQGTVSFGASLSSLNISTSTFKSANFAKTSLRQSQFIKQSAANEKIVKLRPGLSAAEAAKVIAGLGGKIKKKLYGTEATYVITVDEQTFSKSAANQISKVEYIEDNLKFQAFDTPNDPLFKWPYYWNYNMLNLPDAWDQQKGNSTVIVAVLDTGISLTHPDLKANLVPGYDFVDDDSDPSDVEYLNEDNRYSHGTHVAGTISAVTNNGIGIAGVAWNVKIMPIRVLDSTGSGDSSVIVEGINWAVNHGANVINLSLGVQVNATDEGTATFRAAIDNAIANGVTVVAAAGNYGKTNPTVCFPANYGPVIAVAALDNNSSIASYSCYGPEIDLFAPGGEAPKSEVESDWKGTTILSTCYDKYLKNNTYVYMVGTSMAAPHVAGVAALLYSRGYTKPSAIETQLKSTAYNLGDATTNFGAGRLDAYTALKGAAYGLAAAKVFYFKLDTGTESAFYDVQINGNYTIPNLQPGQYIVCAFIDKDNDGTVSSGDMSGISPEVTVTAGNTTTVNLSLEEVPSDTATITVKEYFQSLLSTKK